MTDDWLGRSAERDVNSLGIDRRPIASIALNRICETRFADRFPIRRRHEIEDFIESIVFKTPIQGDSSRRDRRLKRSPIRGRIQSRFGRYVLNYVIITITLTSERHFGRRIPATALGIVLETISDSVVRSVSMAFRGRSAVDGSRPSRI